MFTLKQRFRRDKTIVQVGILKNEQPLTYYEVIQLWKKDSVFSDFFTQIIKDAPYPALYWETPPITSKNVHRYFEMVLIKSRSLVTIKPEPTVFQEHFDKTEKGTAVFPNLGKNAILVSPKPTNQDDYSHLKAFVQNASLTQIQEFWKTLAHAIEERLEEDRPVWISTAGNGVYWLHVRLDSRPKYYKYPIYKIWES